MADEQTEPKLRGKHPTEDLIYERLIDAIIDKHLRAGEHVNEVKLAEAYDVPRSRVRRVLDLADGMAVGHRRGRRHRGGGGAGAGAGQRASQCQLC